MSDNPKEAEKEMEKAIFISADCWLEVFDLLPPSQLGFGIALISHRFDCRVDEHFKTRKWKLGQIAIHRKIGQNGAKEPKIVNSNRTALPIPHYPLPKKIIGFGSISINFIDQNVITFLGHFHRFFATCATMLNIITENVRVSEFVVLNIWSMFKDTIYLMHLNVIAFHQIRQLAPSLLTDCPSLRVVIFHFDILPEFPPDDSANASDGQAVTKWLFTPRPENLSKMLIVNNKNISVDQWLATVEQIKAAFSSASSSAVFRIFVVFPPSSSLSSVVPFELTNEFTGEKLKLSKDGNGFNLFRRPIVPKMRQQQNIVKLADRWNRINISITDYGIDDGLLDAASAGPSGDQKEQKK